MRDYLLFQLYGPLAAWGEQAVGDDRDSATHPSKSAMLGLVAAALGITREDDVQHCALNAQLGLGVKLLNVGHGLDDLHTAHKAEATARIKHIHTRRDELAHDKLTTVLSHRAYRQDALAVVALWQRGDVLHALPAIRDALQRPKYALYLGRRACVLGIPLAPKIVQTDTLRTALDSYAPDPLITQYLHSADKTSHYYWEATEQAGLESDYQTMRYDSVLSRRRWQFSSRTEFLSVTQVGADQHVPE